MLAPIFAYQNGQKECGCLSNKTSSISNPRRILYNEVWGQGEESAVYKQFVADPNTEEQKKILDRIFVLNYDDKVRLK
jgi:hypothetical protein